MEVRTLGERMVRDKNEVTLPILVREKLNLKPGDLIRFELENGVVSIHKIITRKIGNSSIIDDDSGG